MRYPPQQAAVFLEEVDKVLEAKETDDIRLWKLWLTLLFMRRSGIGQDLKRKLGGTVFSGPFKGMALTPAAMTDNFVPQLLGCYEHELHPTIEQMIGSGYQKILNIGCAFGYYSVGLALRMPRVMVDAFDIAEKEQARCQEMALLNGVADRVAVGGEFRGEDFARYAGVKTLAIVDIEGAETALLDPARWPALQKMDLLIEMHDLMDPTISKKLLERFARTHECEMIRNKPMLFPLEDVFQGADYIDPFDCLIAAWEIRDGVTPWGIFRVKR